MNIEKARQDTKGLSDKIFLNSAGSSLMPGIVIESMIDYFHQEEQFGGYDVASRNADLLEQFYEETAKLINCKALNIAFATSATDAFAKAMSSIVFEKGDCIITTVDDYISSQISFISLQNKLHVKIIRMKNLHDNELDLDDFENLIKKHQPKLVAVTHIPSNSGLIQNVEGIGEICRQYNILYLVDACQSVGQLPVDIEKIQCDFLTATGRKYLRGPRGTGFLYVSDRVLEQDYAPLLLDAKGAKWSEFDDYELMKSAKRFEYFEYSYGSLVGFTEALKYANYTGLENIEAYNRKLSEKLREKLQNSGFKILDQGNRLSSIVTFCGADGDLGTIQKILRDHQVYFSVSYRNSALIDFTNKNVQGAVRFSPHYFNTMEEIDKVSEILNK